MSGSGLPPVVLDSGIECWAPTTLLVPQVRGFLWVRKGGDKKWVRRYVLCRANFLYWFGEGEVERPAKPLGACCFEDMLVQPLEPPPENPELDGFAENAFWLSPQQEAKGGGLFSGGSKRVFEFCAETEEAAQEWTQALVVWRYSLLAQDRIQLDVTRAELDETAAQAPPHIHTHHQPPPFPPPIAPPPSPQPSPQPIHPPHYHCPRPTTPPHLDPTTVGGLD